jgi:hypothetical protein
VSRATEVRLHVTVCVPLLDPLLEDFNMFKVCHCRVTSLDFEMLRMISEGHTVCDSSRAVNADHPKDSGSAASVLYSI